MHQCVYLGVDGGGTRTTAVAALPDGTVFAKAVGQGINYNNIGMSKARQNLYETLCALPPQCLESYEGMCIGMSALDYAADPDTIRAFAGDLFDASKLDMQSDAYTALMGFTLGKPGTLIICGTGSMLLMLDHEGRQTVSGGWGHILGDPGSSHAIAMGGLRAAINHWEGLEEAPALAEAACRHFQLDFPRQLIDRVFAPDCTPDVIASFAREVLMLCQQQDAQAIKILQSNMAHAAREAAALIRTVPEAHHVGLHGGVFTHNPIACALFTKELQALIPTATTGMPTYPPELGALIHLFAQKGMLNQRILDQMKQSYLAL